MRASILKAKEIFATRHLALNAIAQLEGIESEHYKFFKELKFKAESKIDELEMQNHWAYLEACIKSFIQYWGQMSQYLSQIRNSEEQIKFENYLQMSKVASDGQLNISALIANMAQ